MLQINKIKDNLACSFFYSIKGQQSNFNSQSGFNYVDQTMS